MVPDERKVAAEDERGQGDEEQSKGQQWNGAKATQGRSWPTREECLVNKLVTSSKRRRGAHVMSPYPTWRETGTDGQSPARGLDLGGENIQ